MSLADARLEEHDEDEDSLFGSPPPSPGRPVSSGLALPSSSYSGSSMTTAPAQNVGTIALPGSQPDSELPMNPLALSLSHGIVQRPPAPPLQIPPVVTAKSRKNAAGPSHPGLPHSRNSSDASSSAPPKKSKKRPRQASSDGPPPKPAGPEFALPDPSAPPPAHFLRNQRGLLGRAGMIAGVKPATLTHIRGSTPSNPILVDDEEDRPILGWRTKTYEKTQPYIDPSLLTAPTNQEIVSVLIGQKDIFPILEGVLKLVMGNTPQTHPKTGFERNSISQPAKKRKLNRVPAGASDWDVPYPFQQGEGPEAYRKTWERERGKQLISQLIKLIKSAARKAATKKYLQEQKLKEEARLKTEHEAQLLEKAKAIVVIGHYRAETVYEAPLQHSTNILQDSINTPSTLQNAPNILNPCTASSSSSLPSQSSADMDPSMAAAFDQLISSLDNPPDPNQPQTTPIPSDTSSIPGTPTSTADVDETLFDTWMSFLQNFPMNLDGMGSQSTSQPLSTSVSQCSTPAPGAGTDDFNFSQMLDACMAADNGSSAGGADVSESTSDFDAILSSMFQQQPVGDGGNVLQGLADSAPVASSSALASFGFRDHLIDPSLLALDVSDHTYVQAQVMSSASATPSSLSTPSSSSAVTPMDSVNTGHGGIGAPMGSLTIPQAVSPLDSGSGSSFDGSTNPGTPVSAGWDLSMPQVFMEGGEIGTRATGSSGDGEGGHSQVWNNGSLGGGFSGLELGLLSTGVREKEKEEQSEAPVGGNGKGKGKEREADVVGSTTASALASTTSSSCPTPTGAFTHTSSTFVPTPFMPHQCIYEPDSAIPTIESLVAKAMLRRLRKGEIVRRAQERKRAMQAELDGVKKRLWETTIEQAGLVALGKKAELVADKEREQEREIEREMQMQMQTGKEDD